MDMLVKRRNAKHTLVLIGILLIAANLRAPITGLPPLLGFIRADFPLSTAAAGALTTLPLLAFAFVSPFSGPLASKYGLERTLFGALACIALGIALRSSGTLPLLFLGTSFIGMGIAVGNVLLPSLVKRDFPQSVATLTGAYVLTMGASAALGSAVAVPLAQLSGWRMALASLLILPLIALMVWWAQLRRPTAAINAAPGTANSPLWKSALAWQVTLFLGLNALIYYVAIGWLPTILIESGWSPTEAGSLHGVMQLATAAPGLFLGPILKRMRDQRFAAVASALLSAIALFGLLAMPQLAVAWAILFGLGTGAGMILGLAFIGLRTEHASQTASLSGMSQSVGYLLAATGPIAMGALHDALNGWRMPLIFCGSLALVTAVLGVLAGRNIRVHT